MLRLLLVTSKSPLTGPDQDGGSMFVAECCRYLAATSRLDILFVREPQSELARLPGIRRVDFVRPIITNGDRFSARLRSAPGIRNWLRTHAAEYDALLIQHVSNAFGAVDLEEKTRRKLIVFPMFTGLSYLRCQEHVPELYLVQERSAMRGIGGIISPSQTEISQLVEGYGVDPRRTVCVPRGIDLATFRFRQRTISENRLELLYVASIKRQKNQLDALNVLTELNRFGIEARLHLIGASGEPEYSGKLASAIVAHVPGNRVVLHGAVSPLEVAGIADGCHLALSVARWETFGRSIFEALAMGLPVLVYEDLQCVWEYVSPRGACMAVPRCPSAMAEQVAALSDVSEEYQRKHLSARAEVEYLEISQSAGMLMTEIERLVK